MEISPGSTPTEESMSEKLQLSLSNVTPPSSAAGAAPGTPGTPGANSVLGAVAALPGLLTRLGDNTLQRISSQQLTQQGKCFVFYHVLQIFNSS